MSAHADLHMETRGLMSSVILNHSPPCTLSQSLSVLHRAQQYWNSGQLACFRNILSSFHLHWDYIQATTPVWMLLGSGDFFFKIQSFSGTYQSPIQTGYVGWLVNPGNLPVSTFSTLVFQVCTPTLGSLQGCLTQVLPHVCMANMFTKLAISQLPNASFLLVSFLAPRANAYANRYEYMLLSLCVLC